VQPLAHFFQLIKRKKATIKKMKKLVVLCVMALSMAAFTQTAQAQKIGYINSEELMASMPETEKANKDLGEYQALLQQQNNDLLKELSEQDSLFVKDSAKLSDAQKTFRRNQLIELYQKVQGFSQKAQEDMQQRQQNLLLPIRTKAMDAIKAVAKESGFGYVIDNANGSLLVAPPGDDILPLVKKKLGIKDAPAAAPAKPAAPGGRQ
jgi:outer membrane protein